MKDEDEEAGGGAFSAADRASGVDDDLSADDPLQALPEHDEADEGNVVDESADARRTKRASDVDLSEGEGGDDFSEEDDDADVASPGEDPLAAPYDLDFGRPVRDEPRRGSPSSNKVRSAKEFFQSEILYRFDLLEREQRERVAGSCRVEIKGNKGGIWTLTAGQQLDVVNRREEAELVLTMQHRDFIGLVNGQLNPQLAILAQKIKVQGDLRRAIHVQSIFAPTND